ncbi:hypothetical protein [Nocardia grenadensis]|uniref:hypothetical protein n=1 Tax=Nocardia grenadensis TaxID=931537 RepID=UPI003D74FB13
MSGNIIVEHRSKKNNKYGVRVTKLNGDPRRLGWKAQGYAVQLIAPSNGKPVVWPCDQNGVFKNEEDARKDANRLWAEWKM